MRTLLLFAFAGIVGTAYSEDIHYTITFAGTAAGDCSVHYDADGSFKGSAQLKLGTIVLDNSIEGKFEGPHLVKSRTISKGGPGPTAQIAYDPGTVTLDRDKDHKVIPYKPTTDLYGGNLLPFLWTSTFAEAKRQLKEHPTLTEIKLKPFFPDLGSELPVTIQAVSPRRAMHSGQPEMADSFKVNFGGIEVIYDTDAKGKVIAFDVASQKIRYVMDGWSDLFTDPLAKYPELSQATFKTKSEPGTKMKTRDGVDLVGDITRPEGEGKYPVILVRTPYGRGGAGLDADFYATRGYVYVAQDCRGRGDSGGEWDPFVHEGDDGFDTIAWLEKQPWCNGRVGMIGGSYGGYVQWAAAVKRPNALKCIVPQVSPPDAMHNLPYEFGVPFLYADVWWAKIVAGKGVDFSSLKGPLPHPEKLASLPLGNVDAKVLGAPVGFLSKWFQRTTSKDWKGFDFLEHMDQANVPALHISGWWDGDGIGTKLNWEAQRRLGRKDQWLIEGPWPHAFNTSTSIGKLNFGPDSLLELESVYLRWFDTWLKEKQVGFDKVPHVQAFVTGANKWLHLSDWPEAGSKTRALYLNHLTLDEKVGAPNQDKYSYDPAKDTDISEIKNGGDVESFTGEIKNLKIKDGEPLIYRSAPLKKTIAIAGPATVDLYFKTSAHDTDLFAMLVDIDEKGKVYATGQPGKIRGSYLGGVDKIRYLTPGKTYFAHLLPWDFAHEFKPGHRIGLVVMSTMFPVYARNLGTTEPIATGTKMEIQRNTVLSGRGTPSKVTFHVLYEK